MKIACVQANVVFNNPKANACRAIDDLTRLKSQGVEIAVFPEAFLTGYCVESSEDAMKIAIATDSEPIQMLRKACDDLDIMAVVGFAETSQEPKAQSPAPSVYNAAALFEPGKEPRFYRKSHLPELGLDKFVCGGHGPLDIFETRIGKIGLLICFDFRMPEATRVLALKGAQILILPTNWPEGAQVTADYVAIARAAENRIFIATCDRVGEENGFKFIGKSKIVHPSGKVLASAGDAEETLMADIDLAEADQKRVVTVPGKYEVEVFKARRPELYSELTRNIEP